MITTSDSNKNIGNVLVDDGTGIVTSDSYKHIGVVVVDDGTAIPTSDSRKMIGRVRLDTAFPNAVKTSDSNKIIGRVKIYAGSGAVMASDSRKIIGTVTLQGGSLNDGDIPATWQDSSGNGHTAAKTGSPTFRKNVLNGKPVVRLTSATFDGFNLASVISGAAPWTIFAVMKATGPTVKCWSLVAIGTNPFGPVELAGVLYVADRSSYETVSTDYSGAFHVFTGTSFGSGGVMELWVDGVSVGSSGPLAATSFDFGQIGYRSDPLYSDGDIAEIVFCNQDADGLAANRANIEKTLSVKYGTPAPPTGSVIDFSTLTTGWWKADSLG